MSMSTRTTFEYRNSRATTGTLALWALGLSRLLCACGSPGQGPATDDADAGEAGLRNESFAPLCSDITSALAPNEVFSRALIDVADVSETGVLGDMDPTSPQEILNFELGFYVPILAPLTAPADLYVESIERSYHSFDDVTDFGLSYHVCSYQDGDTRKPAVYGNFAHVTSLNADLTALFDAELAKVEGGQDTAMRCSGPGNEECTLNMNALRDTRSDPGFFLVVEAGAPLGQAGPGPGKTGPAGIDANLLDIRQNDFHGNYYINPNRLGAEGGPGAGWRYGICTYEYFVEPYRTQYLDKITNLGQKRVSAELPCGTVEIDKGAEGTLGGMWALSSIGTQVMQTEFGGGVLDDYLFNLLALGDHLVTPETKMMLSVSIDNLSNLTGEPSVIAFDKAIEFDENWNNFVNRPFKTTGPGQIYCYAGIRYGGFEEAFYLMDLSQDGATMRLEKVEADCRAVSPENRAFDPTSPTFYSFVR